MDKQPVRAAGLGVGTRRQRRDESAGPLLVQDAAAALSAATLEASQDYKGVAEKLKHFGNTLHEDIEDETFDKDHRDIINTTRDILDYDCFLKEMNEQELSPDIYSANTFPRFSKAVKAPNIPGLECTRDKVLSHQYCIFMQILVEFSQKNKKVDPKQILVQLFDEKCKLFHMIQIVLHIASYAATKSSVESVMESIVS